MQTLGPYRIKRTIALGGMGEVFLAALQRVGGFEKQVALKCVLPRFVQDPTFKDLFEQEARLAAVLNHRNIVQVFDFGYDQERAWLAMEYVDGVDVKAVYDSMMGPLPLGIGLNIGVSVARALHYAHRAVDARSRPLHIVHRDVSPQNILLSYEGDIKLADFGLAFAAARDLEDDRSLKGKFAYMSPEQVKGQALDGRSDQFSLGVVLYEICSGRRAFFREGGPSNILKRVAQGEPLECLSTAAPHLDPAIVAVIQRAMAPNRTDRFPDAGALADALSEAASIAQISLGMPNLGGWLVHQLPRRSVAAPLEASSVSEGTAVATEPIVQPVGQPERTESVERTLSAPQIGSINPESTTADFQVERSAQPANSGATDDGVLDAHTAVQGHSPPRSTKSQPRGGRLVAVVLTVASLGVALIWLYSAPTPQSSQAMRADPPELDHPQRTLTVDDAIEASTADARTADADAAISVARRADASVTTAFDAMSADAASIAGGRRAPNQALFSPDAQVIRDSSIPDSNPIRRISKAPSLKSRVRQDRRRIDPALRQKTMSRSAKFDRSKSTTEQRKRGLASTASQLKARPAESSRSAALSGTLDATLAAPTPSAPDASGHTPVKVAPVSLEGHRFRLLTRSGSVQTKASPLGRGWRRVSGSGTMIKVTDVTGAIVRMRLRGRSGRFDATIHAKPNADLIIDGRAMGSTPMASIPLREGLQNLVINFTSGASLSLGLELGR
ncbi:MAG: protein kinase [Myxococcota bacterium]|nr:protein kinase [Myxococcota bacterium]